MNAYASDWSVETASANEIATERIKTAAPYWVGVERAGDVLPGMTAETILTSGPPMEWGSYTGGQAQAIIGAALFEGLAGTAEEARAKLESGEIDLGGCHDYGAVGSLAGVYSASMPVFVVEDRANGTFGYCNLFEGASRKRLNYGVYDSEVADGLRELAESYAPELSAALKALGGEVFLRPIVRQALHMGDELHSRNKAATLLLTRRLIPGLIARPRGSSLERTVDYLDNDYMFLRIGMAAAKAAADAAHGISGSSVVTAMAFSCREFGIRVSGLGDQWFRAPLPRVEATLFDGYTDEDIEIMGGESTINETVGLGGLAQAAAFGLQSYQGGTASAMVEANLAMYEICISEHPEYTIPFLGFRGVPVGIDIRKVLTTGITPFLDVGVAGRQGGQIGAGTMRVPFGCFEAAGAALEESP